MSTKNKPSFKVDGKSYELTYTSALRREYKRMTDEKIHDTVYQDEIAEYARLESRYKRIHEAYLNAENELIKDPQSEKLRNEYEGLGSLEKNAFTEFRSYASTHPNGDGTRFAIDCLEKLIIFALKEQYHLRAKEAESVWCKYVEQNGEESALLFLSFVGSAWFIDTNESDDTPFIKARKAKVIAANNRRIGLRNINK